MWAHSARASSGSAGYTTPKVSPDAFLAAIWALTAFAFLFLPARLYARWTTFRRFFWDDFFVAFAWILSLSITAAVTALNPVTYEIMLIGAGKLKLPPNVKIIVMQFSRLFFVVPMIFYAGLWSVKIAFLLFFRRLGTRSLKGLRYWWWVVLGITLLCYGLCYTTLPYRCCLVSYEVLASPECATQGWSFISMKVNCALDVFTDCLIMSIPFVILRRVRISRRQKLALSGIFSLVVITIIFAIVRAAITTVGVERQMDPIWMYLWTSIELNVAIVVACVAPYRTLFIRDRSPSIPRPLRLRANAKDNAFKIFTSSRKLPKGASDDTWSTAELPYLAPWVDNSGTLAPDPNRLGVLESCEDTLTANTLPSEVHWVEEEIDERRRDDDAIASDPVHPLSPLQKAHESRKFGTLN